MKYIVVLGDGMSDESIDALFSKTPLEYASTPMMDKLSKWSEIGLAHMIPEGMSPGSDTANLAVLGYDPKKYYTGRSPLEALSIGVDMKETDIALRCNFVTISDDNLPYEQKTIIDHSSSEISTKDAAILLQEIKKELETSSLQADCYNYYVGTSYRHLTIWKNGKVVDLTAPHDILGKTIGCYLPTEHTLKEMMRNSYEILNNHPLNIERAKAGLNKANSIWFWGAGTKPNLDSFQEKTGFSGVMISAVDLLKGIAVGSGMKNIIVEGANGTLNTNYEGKAMAAVKALTEDDYDFAYIHVEAPDEMGHQGSAEKKIKAIEYLDQRVIQIVYEQLWQKGVEFKLLVCPDHPTPIRVRTHTSDPIPYMIYNSTKQQNQTWNYNEREAKKSGNEILNGYQLLDHFLEK